jgi:hypothetical protein
MALYGYARVSTLDQNLGIQRAALKAAGCDVIRAEKARGTRRDGRTELQVLLDFLRPGDALVITRIDRLARSLKDLQDIVHELKERRVALRATEQPINTGTAAGKAFLDMLGVFAELAVDGVAEAPAADCFPAMFRAGSVLAAHAAQAGIGGTARRNCARDDTLALLEPHHRRAELCDHAHRLVPNGQALGDGIFAFQDVDVCAADRGGGDFQHHIQRTGDGDRFFVQHDAAGLDKNRSSHLGHDNSLHEMVVGSCPR